MNVEEEEVWSSLETGDVDILFKQLSNSQREMLVETLHQCLETSGEMLVESDFSDLQLMKESDGNERVRESGKEGICCVAMISNSPGVGELQPIMEDQSLFFDLAQKDFHSTEDSHNHPLFQSDDLVSEFSDTYVFSANLDPSETAQLSSEAFELYHPVETVAVDDWRSTSVHGFEVGSPGEAEPTQSCLASGSPGLVVILDSDRTLTSPPNGFVASQRSRFDIRQLSILPTKTMVPNQEICSVAAVNQIQVVKTECREEWPASEVSEGEFEVKKERRRQQNRTAARRCRNRKKETFEYMVKAAQKAKLENVALKKTVVHLREQLNSVMELVKLHQTHCGLQLTVSQVRGPVSASPS